ncbi:MAG TPA: hypothetical protein VGF00_06760 [Acidimicrobiia bacterium]
MTSRTFGILLLAAGAVAIGIGAGGIAGASLLAEQIPYVVSGAIGGVALIALGVQVLAGVAMGREREELARVEAAILSRRLDQGLPVALDSPPRRQEVEPPEHLRRSQHA